MSNALHRDIKPGERVVIMSKLLKPEYQELSKRIFVCQFGFGMTAATMGAMIHGYYESDGPEAPDSIRGEWISFSETEALRSEP